MGNQILEDRININKNQCQSQKIITYNQGLLFQKFTISLTLKQYQYAFYWYQKRLKMQKHIFKINSLTPLESKNCLNNILVQIQYQYCINIKQIKILQHQILYVLLSMLYGYSQLFTVTNSHFLITIDMIWVNIKGEVKVWYSENLLKTWLDQPNIDETSEQKLVKRIFEIIQSNPTDFQIPNSLKTFKEENLKKYNFSESIQLLKNFAKKYNFCIPFRIKNVQQYFNHQSSKILNSTSLDYLLTNSIIEQNPKRYGQEQQIRLQKYGTNKKSQYISPNKLKKTINNITATTLPKGEQDYNQNYDYQQKSRRTISRKSNNTQLQSFKIHEPDQQVFDISYVSNTSLSIQEISKYHYLFLKQEQQSQ